MHAWRVSDCMPLSQMDAAYLQECTVLVQADVLGP